MEKKLKTALTRFLIEDCTQLAKYGDSDRKYCRLKYDKRCNRNGNFWLDYEECPHNCPHHPSNMNVDCEGANCYNIKKKLKRIEQYLKDADEKAKS